MKSTLQTYGTIARSLHWLMALFIVILLITGFRAGFSSEPASKIMALRIHMPVAILTLGLTVARIVWWVIDTKPAKLDSVSAFQDRIARIVHRALYLLTILLLISGIGLSVLSGLPDALFGGAPLPIFDAYPPRALHGLAARLLSGLLFLHVVAALYHHFIAKDDSLRRMASGQIDMH